MITPDIRYITLRASAGLVLAPPLAFLADLLAMSLHLDMPADWFTKAVSAVIGLSLAVWFVKSRAMDPCHTRRLWLYALSTWIVAMGGLPGNRHPAHKERRAFHRPWLAESA